MTLAGLLEIADREFQAIQEEDDAIRANAQTLIYDGRLQEVEVTPDALRSYLELKLGPDERISDYTYDWMARIVLRLGFQNLGQVDACIAGLDDDKLSRLVLGGRRGQVSRFEILLVASMGENYFRNHPWNQNSWFKAIVDEWLERLRKNGVAVGSYMPLKPEI